jgi:hypothetical protein
MVTSRVLATSRKPLTPGSSWTTESASIAAGRAPLELISSTLRRDSRASGVAAVTQRRRKSGRVLIFSFCRVSSSQSCSTMHRLVPAGARSTNCGLSTKLVWVRSPPAVASPQLPTAHAPQKPNSALPGMVMIFCFLRSIEDESARAMLASSSKRIALKRACCSTSAMHLGTSETRLTSARAASSVMAVSCICAKRSCE